MDRMSLNYLRHEVNLSSMRVAGSKSAALARASNKAENVVKQSIPPTTKVASMSEM